MISLVLNTKCSSTVISHWVCFSYPLSITAKYDDGEDSYATSDENIHLHDQMVALAIDVTMN